MTALEITAYVVLCIMLLVLGSIFFKPLKSVFTMMLQSSLGGAGLYIFNLIFSGTGFFIGINILCQYFYPRNLFAYVQVLQNSSVIFLLVKLFFLQRKG